MKTSFSGIGQRKLATVLAGGAALMLMSSFATASISTTRHNLTSSNGAGFNNLAPTAGNGEICVFCHTPHGADSSASVPIWNRTLDSTTVYTRYSALNTATFDAAEAPIGSVSIACLSCHDGTQAMNVMINTPGSGTTGTIAGTWSGNNVDSGGLMLSPGNVGGKGEFPRLGTDLSNDHPISMQYGGGGIVAGGTGPTKDLDFAQSIAGNSPNPRSGSTIGEVGERTLGSGKPVWWVEVDGAAGQSKTDLTLYTRTDGSGSAAEQPFVECASCHDPHTNNTTFLRHTSGNDNSATCLTCHNK
jgi:predicted CXXCH cytochrome family protein